MKIVSDSFIDLLCKKFFKESRFLKTHKSTNDWREEPRKIQPREIFSHFSGSYYLGFICRETPINIMVFDIDSHSAQSQKTLTNRVKKVQSIFGNTDFIYTSPNNGFHLYYFLDKEYHPKIIQSIVKAVLKIRPGEIELYPGGRGQRLFGGQGCQILDNKLRTINIDFEEYIQNVWELNERLDLNSLKSDIIQKKFSKEFITDCENTLKYGILKSSTRNQELLKLNRYLRGYMKYSPEKTENILCDWIRTKNNNLSKDWKRNPNAVYRHIHEIVIRFDKDKLIGLIKFSFPHQILSDYDLEIIHQKAIEVSNSLNANLDSTENFLKDLISYCKQNQQEGIVEIPKRVFQSCKNGSGKRYVEFKKVIIKSRILSPIKNYSTASHKCIKYKLLSDFHFNKSEHILNRL